MIRDRVVSHLTDSQQSSGGFSRRKFIQAGVADSEAEAVGAATFAPNAFIRIGSDGQIVLVMRYVEMGQGDYTAISMLIAEELEVSLDQVRPEHAPPDPKLYGNPLLAGVQATGGSTAIRAAWKPMREAGAVAGTMLSTDGEIDLAYALPNFHVEYLRVEPPGVPTAFWRSVGPSHNVFVTESFIDELAAAKQDPVAYRRALLDIAAQNLTPSRHGQ